MKKVENRNLDNEKKLVEARLFVFSKLIYKQKIPFSYTMLTDKGLFLGIPIATFFGSIANVFAGGTTFTWTVALMIPIQFLIYKKYINISYVNRYSKIYVFNKMEQFTKGVKKRLRAKRPLMLIGIALIFSFQSTNLSASSLQDSTQQYNDKKNEFIKYIEEQEKKNKYAKSSQELKKLNSGIWKTYPIQETTQIILKQTQLKSIEK